MADLNDLADLNDAAQFVVCVAVGVSCILNPLLEFLKDTPFDPILPAALAVALPFTYLLGILLLQLQFAPARALPPAPAQARRLACFACTMVSALLFVLAVTFVAFLLLTEGLPSRGEDMYPS